MTITAIDFSDRAAGPYTASAGQTVFSYDFPVYAEGDLDVWREREGTVELLTLTTDYTVTGVGNENGGTIVLTAGATEGDIIAIDGSLLKQRATSFVGGVPFKSGNIDTDLNRLAIMVQELAREVMRAPRRLPTDELTGDLSLPFGVTEDTLLALDSTGKLIGRIPKDFFTGVEGAGVGSSEESATDGHVPVYDGASGLLLRSAGFAPRSAEAAVPIADLENISTARILGRTSSLDGPIEQLTPAQVLALTGATRQFQCYMSLHADEPVLVGDAIAQTAVYLHPFHGNMALVSSGSAISPRQFAKQTLELVSAHAANTIYDCFLWDDDGTLRFITGPAWANSAAGAGARGTGASSTELARLDGVFVNAVSMTGRNGANTWTVPAQRAVYVGSIYMDGTNGQVTCHRSFGQARKWGLWNAYNRRPLFLKAGDSTASWSYVGTTVRASNNSSNNSLTVFQGLAEETYDITFNQNVRTSEASASDVAQANAGIGFNSTLSTSGKVGHVGTVPLSGGDPDTDVIGNAFAQLVQAPSIGINTVTSLEAASLAGADAITWFGGEDDMLLLAQWMG